MSSTHVAPLVEVCPFHAFDTFDHTSVVTDDIDMYSLQWQVEYLSGRGLEYYPHDLDGSKPPSFPFPFFFDEQGTYSSSVLDIPKFNEYHPYMSWADGHSAAILQSDTKVGSYIVDFWMLMFGENYDGFDSAY